MERSSFAFVLLLCLVDNTWTYVYSGPTFLLDNGRNVTNASLGVSYHGNVNSGDEDIFYFQVAKQVKFGEVRICMSCYKNYLPKISKVSEDSM